MGRRSETRSGLWVCGLALGSLLAWIAGWGGIAAVAFLAMFAVAAAAAGVDSRSPGDWTRPDGS